MPCWSLIGWCWKMTNSIPASSAVGGISENLALCLLFCSSAQTTVCKLLGLWAVMDRWTWFSGDMSLCWWRQMILAGFPSPSWDWLLPRGADAAERMLPLGEGVTEWVDVSNMWSYCHRLWYLHWDLQEQGCCFITVKTNNWSNKFTALCSGNPSLVRLPWVTVRPFRIETSQHYRTPAHKQVFSHGTAVCTLFICITLWWPNILSGPFLDEFYCKHGRPPSVKPQTHSASLCMFSLSATLNFIVLLGWSSVTLYIKSLRRMNI